MLLNSARLLCTVCYVVSVLVASVIAIFLLRLFIKYLRVAKQIDKIPGPKCSLFLGKFLGNLELFWTLRNIEDIYEGGFNILLGLAKLFRSCGHGVFRAWLGPFEHVVVLFRDDTVEALLSSNVNIEKAQEYRFVHPWLGLGLLTSTGDLWRSHRKLLTPAFHFRILENFVPIINEQQRIMIDIIDERIKQNNGVIDDIRPIITNCALDTICETAMGFKINAQRKPNFDYITSIRSVLLIFFQRFISPWIWNERVFRFTRMGAEFYANVKILHRFTDTIIRERKSEILQKIAANELNIADNTEDALNTLGLKRRQAFLDSLLIHHIKYPNELTVLDVRSEVDTFMFEGHDTTSSALQFALLLIGLNPETQKKIHLELDDIFGDDMNRDITIEDLRRMKYMEMCIKESLRLYPSVPYIARHNSKPFDVEGYTVPPETTCLVLIYMLHRDAKIFPNPEVFIPDRFDSDNTLSRHPYAYVPFSAGPRNCIGQKFALLEEKALLASILRVYEITSLIHRDEVKLDVAAILKPKSPIRMRFQCRSAIKI